MSVDYVNNEPIGPSASLMSMVNSESSLNPDYALGAKKMRKILMCIVNLKKVWPPYWW